MKSAATLAGLALVALCFASIPERVHSQSTLGAPTNVVVSAATTEALTVTWSAPSDDGGTAITSYDLRYIETTAPDKADTFWTVVEAWTSGTLEYYLAGLLDGVEYDVELRADNGTEGPWSTTITGTTTDHGATTSAATTLTVASPMVGAIYAEGDEDLFKIVLAAATDIWLYTDADFDAKLELLNSSGSRVASNDNGHLPHGPLNPSIRRELAAGTHYVRVKSNTATGTGVYTLFSQSVTDPGSTLATATTIEAGTAYPGRISPSGGPDGDHDVFKIVLDGTTDLWVRSIGTLDTYGELLDQDEMVLASNNNSAVVYGTKAFMLRKELGAGTYYIQVRGRAAGDTGAYTLYAEAVADPGTSSSTAKEVELRALAGGQIDTAQDVDYFSITAPAARWVRIYGLGAEAITLTASVHQDSGLSDSLGDDREFQDVASTDWPSASRDRLGFWVEGRLRAGTSYIQVESRDGGTGRYVLHVVPHSDAEPAAVLGSCANTVTPGRDALFGCQWHLKNTNQLGSGPGLDINVEAAWETTKGEGVNVMVVDDGVYYRHDDLRANYDPALDVDWTYTGDVFVAGETHGTAVAGVILARDNGTGLQGVAPRATLGVNNVLFEGGLGGLTTDSALSDRHASVAVYNHSWGFPSGLVLMSDYIRGVFSKVLEKGYSGKGSVSVFSAGNSHGSDQYANLDEYINHYAVVTVCAVTHGDVRAPYSEEGPNLWVCAPSDDSSFGISNGIPATAPYQQYREFGGTSAAAPIVSGVVALVRAANNNLTWRDVKVILANSARKNDATNSGWTTGALKYDSTMDHYHYNHSYGFGVVDAGAAVSLAVDWNILPNIRAEIHSWSGSKTIVDLGPTFTQEFTLIGNVEFVEYVSVRLGILHRSMRDLRIELESPSGATSLLSREALAPGYINGSIRLGTARHLGESSDGVWKVHIQDNIRLDVGTVSGIEITVYGHGVKPTRTLAANMFDTTDGAFLVCWDAPHESGTSAITSYDLQYRLTDWVLVEGVATDSDECYDLIGLVAGRRYELQVRAVNSHGPGPWSNTTSGTIPVPPGAPQDVQVVARNGGLGVTWEEPESDGGAAEDYYDVRSIETAATDKSDSEWTVVRAWSRNDTDLRYNITSLTNDTEYDVQVRAENRKGKGDWSSTQTGTPGPNLDPEFPTTEMGQRSVAENTQQGGNIGLPVVASDPEGDALHYSLSEADDLVFDIEATTGQLMIDANLDYEAAASRSVTVMVSDQKDINGDEDPTVDDSILVTVTVQDVNDAPQIAAPADPSRTVKENFEGILFDFDATDQDDDDDTLNWSLQGTDRLDFSLNSDGQLSFAAPPDYEAPVDAGPPYNKYEVTVRASDGALYDDLEVEVEVEGMAEPPRITSGPTEISWDENATGTLGTYRGTDDEGDAFTFEVDGDDYRLFEIYDDPNVDDDPGILTFKLPPDYEARSDNVYEIEVGIFELLAGTHIDVSVTVNNVNEAPEISGSAHVVIEENATDYVGRYSVTDPENHATPWLLSGLDAGDFAFDDSTGELELRLANVPDYDAPTDHNRDNVYEVTLRSSDDGLPSLTGEFKVTVAITGVDEAPVITGPDGPDDTSIEVPEGTQVTMELARFSAIDPDGGTVILSHSGLDAGDFSFNNGVLAFLAVPDYELPADANTNNVYEVTIEAADASDTATLEVTVTVENEDEAGTLSLSSEQPQVGTGLTATLTDPDGGLTDHSWTWARSPNASTWTDISSAPGGRYTPVEADENQYLRVTVSYKDGHAAGKGLDETADDRVRPAPVTNEPPVFDADVMTREVHENTLAGRPVGSPVQATDPDVDDQGKLGHTLDCGLDACSFTIDTGTGQIRVGATTVLDHESQASYTVTVIATDPSTATASTDVTISVLDVNEPPVATDAQVDTNEDTPTTIDILDYVDDPENGDLTVSVHGTPMRGSVELDPSTNTVTYTPRADTNGIDSFRYSASDPTLRSNPATISIRVIAVNDAPRFTETDPERSVSQTAAEGDNVGAPVAAIDVDDAPLALTYSLSGSGASFFEIEEHTGQIKVGPGAVLDATNQPTHMVTVTADDGKNGGRGSVEVTITVTTGPVAPPIITGGGGGGGGPSGPSPSKLDFEWTVTRDIEELASDHGSPTGGWSDGVTLWLLENGDGADDAIYAYDLASGERVEGRELQLDERNRAPRGVWSNRTTLWVSDSGQNKLFAHDFASGERLPDSDIALAERNRDARGIWSNEVTMWVLDGGKDALFAYDLVSGDAIGEYALDSTNRDPRGIWSDGVTIWVSDHGEKDLLAYQLPVIGAEGAPAEAKLERVRDEDFTELSKASNNSPRGIWSDGDVMYVADESDGRVYTYNMPDAIDARLATLTLSGVDIGEFGGGRTEYEGVPGEGVTETTVEATTVQRRTEVAIHPPDADEEADGHQVALEGVTEITVTVTSADGSRTKAYRVAFQPTATEFALSPTWSSFEWPGLDGTAIVDALREGGILDRVLVIYEWDEAAQTWKGFFPGLEDVPGLNTLTTLQQGSSYWIAVTEPITWTVPAP